MTGIDIDHLRGWIGREEVAAESLTPSMMGRFNATFDRDDPTDEGAEAPPVIHWCLAPPAAPTASLGPDGHPARGGFLPPVPLPRRMWAGGALTVEGPIRVGERVTRRSTIRDVTLKEGRSGRLCFVTVDHQIDSAGRTAVRERQDIVYRDVTPPGGTVPKSAPAGTHQVRVTPSAPLLFRYSALTFNGHRIHYDAPYVTGEEGYPGLIVHGPLQASQLMLLAQTLGGRPPAQFDFRSLSPIFDTDDYTLNATEDGAGLRLWTATLGGPVAMQATATW